MSEYTYVDGTFLTLCVVFYSYAYVVIPIYRSAGVSGRLLISTIFHPLVYEFGATAMRYLGANRPDRSAFCEHFALGFFEAVMVLLRRFLITDLGSSGVMAVAVAVSR